MRNSGSGVHVQEMEKKEQSMLGGHTEHKTVQECEGGVAAVNGDQQIHIVCSGMPWPSGEKHCFVQRRGKAACEQELEVVLHPESFPLLGESSSLSQQKWNHSEPSCHILMSVALGMGRKIPPEAGAEPSWTMSWCVTELPWPGAGVLPVLSAQGKEAHDFLWD